MNNLEHPIRVLESAEDIDLYIESLYQRQINALGVDFEGEANKHRYGTHLCLIQFFDGFELIVIDVIVAGVPESLVKIMTDASVLKIMFSTDFDVRLWNQSSNNRHIKGLIDLQLGAKYLGLGQVSLETTLNHFLAINFQKNKKLQSCDWSRRPLKEDQLIYASGDVHYLFSLYDTINGQLSEAQRKFWTLENKKMTLHTFKQNKRPWLSVKGISVLSREQRVLLKHLFICREQVAQTLNFPTHWVLGSEQIIELCQDYNRELLLKYLPPKAHKFLNNFLSLTKNYKEEWDIQKNKPTGFRPKNWNGQVEIEKEIGV